MKIGQQHVCDKMLIITYSKSLSLKLHAELPSGVSIFRSEFACSIIYLRVFGLWRDDGDSLSFPTSRRFGKYTFTWAYLLFYLPNLE